MSLKLFGILFGNVFLLARIFNEVKERFLFVCKYVTVSEASGRTVG